VTLLRADVPDIRIRVVNVVDLMVLQPQSEHPHGMEDQDFDELFTTDKPVIFAFHGYPAMIHKLTYRRHNHDNIPCARLQGGGHHHDALRHGRAEQSRPLSTRAGRHQAHSAVQRSGGKGDGALLDAMERHKLYISEHGDDMPEVRDWRWNLWDSGPAQNVLALNSGSSSLKFGLYSVGISRSDALLIGEAEFGDKIGKFHAKDLRENKSISETVARPDHQRGNRPHWPIARRFQIAGACRHRTSDCPWRTQASATLLDRRYCAPRT
jgi:hypothetical protein